MQSQSRLISALALFACGFLVQPSFAQEALSPRAMAGDENSSDDNDDQGGRQTSSCRAPPARDGPSDAGRDAVAWGRSDRCSGSRHAVRGRAIGHRRNRGQTGGILLVSEEPSSPIINFGYRGLDSQRSEFMPLASSATTRISNWKDTTLEGRRAPFEFTGFDGCKILL
jgi:hypothetical protein